MRVAVPAAALMVSLAFAGAARADDAQHPTEVAAAAPAPSAAAPGALSAPGEALASRSAAPAAATSRRRLRLLGIQVNGGVPDGAVLSLVVRPVKWVRLDGGIAHNYFGVGAQGGVTLVPFHWAVVPTLRLEAGRFFRSDVSSKVSRFASDVPTYLAPAMSAFGYDYGSALIGLEFGSHQRFVFFLRAGLTWIRADFGGVSGIRDEATPGVEYDVSGLSMRASGPTAGIGFLFYVW